VYKIDIKSLTHGRHVSAILGDNHRGTMEKLKTRENVIKLPTDITAEFTTPAKHLVSSLIFSLEAASSFSIVSLLPSKFYRRTIKTNC
jgi:hypothetical protein